MQANTPRPLSVSVLRSPVGRRELHGRAEQAARLARVVAQVVDRLAHVAQRALERLAGLAHDHGHELGAVAFEEIRRGFEYLRTCHAALSVPGVLRLGGTVDGGVGLRRRGDAHRADALAPVVRAGEEARRVAAGRRLPGDDRADLEGLVQRHRHSAEQLGAHAGIGQREARCGLARQIDLARTRDHTRRRRIRRTLAHRNLDRVADDLGNRRLGVGQPVDEGCVGAVLQEPAHEISEQLLVPSDGRVDAARASDAPVADHALVERLAHAVQPLELEHGWPPGDVRGGKRVRVVGRNLRIEGLGVAQQQAHAREVGYVGVRACA